jgi:hypothetical protein
VLLLLLALPLLLLQLPLLLLVIFNGNARGKWRLETYREGTHDTDSVRMTQKKQTLLHGYSLLSRIDTQTDTHTHTHAQNTTISTSSVVEREAEEAV